MHQRPSSRPDVPVDSQALVRCCLETFRTTTSSQLALAAVALVEPGYLECNVPWNELASDGTTST